MTPDAAARNGPSVGIHDCPIVIIIICGNSAYRLPARSPHGAVRRRIAVRPERDRATANA